MASGHKYSYDAAGNLTGTTGAATSSFTWDYRNRMLSAWVSGATSTYQYDHTIARMAQITPTTTTHYPNKFYSIEYQGAGTTTATSTAYIFHGDTLIAYVEQALEDGAATGTPTTYYVHPDHLGSTNVVTDENGDVVQVLDYYPYGSERISSGQDTSQKTYIGLYSDDSTDLLYANARYLDPARGQFLSQDPSFHAIGDPAKLAQLNNQQQKMLLADPQAQNSYSYARGNSIVNKDPSGLCFEPVSALACIYGAYTAATLAVDAYDVIQTNFIYGDVFTQEEKNRTNFKAGLDVVLTATGIKLARDAGKAAGVGFDSLTSTLDALDHYFGEEIYKKYNENRDPNKKQQSTMQSSKPSVNVSGTNNANTNISRQGSSQSGGSGYNRLVSGLQSLVSSLKSYVSSLQSSKDKKK